LVVQENSWHSFTVKEVFRRLGTSENGLTSADVHKRLAEYGPNEIIEEKGTTKITLFFYQLKSPLIAVLLVATLISLLIGNLIDAIVIGAVIIINTNIGFFQEYKAETALQALKSMAGPESKVFRECTQPKRCVEAKVKARDIVPGDIILLEAGDKVPADARIFQAVNLEIDESMLTGESTAARKTVEVLPEELPVADRVNMAFSGTIVLQGRGKAVVVATGTKTEIGKIATLIGETARVETPFQKRTNDLSRKLGIFALLASISVFFVAFFLNGFDLLETFLFALATAVSAIPEGLPAVITITLAVGVNRMAKRNALIRKLQAVDTLGSATVICTDKTGTLTTNQMTVRKIFVDNRIITVTGEGFSPEGQFQVEQKAMDPKKDEALTLLLQVGALCNDSKLLRIEDENRESWKVTGDPTEGALVVAATKGGINMEELESQLPRVDELPFDPKERFMATSHSFSDGIKVLVKGAPEVILGLSSKILDDNRINELTEKRREKLHKISMDMASQALRTLAMAYQTIKNEELESFKSALKEKRAKLVFVGFAGMIDPPRKEAKSAVALCKRAGIRVVMATGDHRLTAEAIAGELGIKGSGGALTGIDLDDMSDDQLDTVICQTSVYARVSPTHKYRIVESLRRQGEVVAMTGDGVNDAPALKAAEIGIAMGITGTDVTKETADMILTDDNFASIISAIEEGRVIFENIRKVVKYLTSTTAGEIITILSVLILLPVAPLIFRPVQILWINLVTDGLLVIPLAMEPKEQNVMDMPPRKPTEKIINRELFFNLLFVGSFMAIGTAVLFANRLISGDFATAQTTAFVTIALFQVFNALNCRSRKQSFLKLGVFSNKYLLFSVLASISLQVLTTELPFFQTAFGTTSLSLMEWAIIVLVASSVFIADEIRKLLFRKFRKSP
jgi:Ca2+-transporting ATPase